MAPRPLVLLLDVNETLSDMSGLDASFAAVGAPPGLRQTWFAGLLRDGMGLAAAGTIAPFAQIASDSLDRLLRGTLRKDDVEGAVERVMSDLTSLPMHPDAVEGLRALSGSGLRLVTLSNGSSSVAEALLERGGVRDKVEACLSVEEAGTWKPAAASYQWALDRCGVPAAEAMLVAVHPWDTDGARRAGLMSAWVDRHGGRYPSYHLAPTLRVTSFRELAARLGE